MNAKEAQELAGKQILSEYIASSIKNFADQGFYSVVIPNKISDRDVKVLNDLDYDVHILDNKVIISWL